MSPYCFATVSGTTLPSTELRVTFEELNPATGNSYVVFKTANSAQDYLMANASVFWATNPEPMVRDNIVGVQFQVSTQLNNTTPFDFCVSNVEILTQ